MAWQTPVIDRGQTATCLPDDLNRICGNINYLIGTSLSTGYTSNDFLTLSQWRAITQSTIIACNKYGIYYTQAPNDAMTSENFNNVENLLLQCYERLNLWQRQANTNIYAQSQYGRYVAVPNNNHVRGFKY